MNQFSHINRPNLLDMLASYTTRYTQMLADNNKTDEFYKYRRMIEQITAELESRQRAASRDDESSINGR